MMKVNEVSKLAGVSMMIMMYTKMVVGINKKSSQF